VDTVQNVRQSFCVVDEVAVASIFQRLAMEVEVAVVEVFRELPLKKEQDQESMERVLFVTIGGGVSGGGGRCRI
jgi:hypothetical protein